METKRDHAAETQRLLMKGREYGVLLASDVAEAQVHAKARVRELEEGRDHLLAIMAEAAVVLEALRIAECGRTGWLSAVVQAEIVSATDKIRAALLDGAGGRRGDEQPSET